MKTEILADLQICISIPLRILQGTIFNTLQELHFTLSRRSVSSGIFLLFFFSFFNAAVVVLRVHH